MIASFLNKIIVCDVYSLKHLIKIESANDESIYDVHIDTDSHSNCDVLKIAYIDENLSDAGGSKKPILSVATCKYYCFNHA